MTHTQSPLGNSEKSDFTILFFHGKVKMRLKPRSITEPWSVSMWEPPVPVDKHVFIVRKKDEKGNETLQFKKIKVLEQKRKKAR